MLSLLIYPGYCQRISQRQHNCKQLGIAGFRLLCCSGTAKLLAAPSPVLHSGVVQRNLRNLERAAQCYQAALQLRPNFPEALNNMAVMYTYQVSLPHLLAEPHCAVSSTSIVFTGQASTDG